jgi:hypothetical protein
MNQLERWAADEVIGLAMTGISQREAARGNAVRAQIAFHFIHTLTPTPSGTDERLKELRSILFPKDTNQNQEKRPTHRLRGFSIRLDPRYC